MDYPTTLTDERERALLLEGLGDVHEMVASLMLAVSEYGRAVGYERENAAVNLCATTATETLSALDAVYLALRELWEYHHRIPPRHSPGNSAV